MSLTARPRSSARAPTPPPVERYRRLAAVMLACGDWGRAAVYEEQALLCEHQAALERAALAAPGLAPDLT